VTAARAADGRVAAEVAARVLTPTTVLLAVITVVVGAVQALGGGIPLAVQVVPFAVSILLFGLPHGALDHLVPARLSGAPVLRSVSVIVALYALLGAATAALWLAAPLLGFASFLLLTWFHWGQGDLYVDRLLGDGATGRTGAALTVAARGAIPMLVPLVAHPDDYALVTAQTAGLLGPHVASPTIPPGARLVAAAVVLGLLLAHAALTGPGRRPRRTALEAVVLVAFFAVVPPVLAVGLYFTLWHSVRHILRLELTDPVAAEELRRGRLLRPFLRFAHEAWPITAIAVVMLLAVALLLRSADLGVYLLLLAALTTPHAVVVSWMDRRQGTWSPAGAVRRRARRGSRAAVPGTVAS
jgi:Brp/Blh family beta-carotene 15,15'-monooxygenase